MGVALRRPGLFGSQGCAFANRRLTKGAFAPMRTVSADAIVSCKAPSPRGRRIGRSRQGRPVYAHRVGQGPIRVSLVGGCHADEPVGPALLDRLVRFLHSPAGESLRATAAWSVIPHVNPDGARANAAWQPPGAASYDLAAYLLHRRRELPGDDVEFGFPRGRADRLVRPENRAAWTFWSEAGPYDLHVSLHGMGVAAGPYFLVERGWWPRLSRMVETLSDAARRAGYALHDVERNGEKGFHRLGRGFCSRPDSDAMRRHFLDRDDPDTAQRFRPSSMEAIRALGGDPLTLVTEMPLFLTPGVGLDLGPPDPVLVRWRETIAGWEARLRNAAATGAAAIGAATDRVRREARRAGLRPMPVADQMRLQWTFIRAGIEAVAEARPAFARGRGRCSVGRGDALAVYSPGEDGKSPGASRSGRNRRRD